MVAAVLFILGSTLAGAAGASPAEAPTPLASPDAETWRTGVLALSAALSVGICVLGASHAVARVGSAAMGSAAERPELLIRTLLFVALAEGLAVLGFAIAMLLVQKI
jgi:V/A-type H+-transporting ATPase subunit K